MERIEERKNGMEEWKIFYILYFIFYILYFFKIDFKMSTINHLK